jgi:hypothetical protein
MTWSDKKIEEYVMRAKPPSGEDSDAWNQWAQVHRDREWEDRVKPALDQMQEAVIEALSLTRQEFRKKLQAAVRKIEKQIAEQKDEKVISLSDLRRGRRDSAA